MERRSWVCCPCWRTGRSTFSKVVYAPEDERWEDFYGFNKGGKWPLAYAGMVAGTIVICVLFWRV